VAEVGAGTGRFSHFLRRRLAELDPKIEAKAKLLASDLRGSTGDAAEEFEVEKLDYKVALKKHNPGIVIVSWMSKDLDMTPDFRSKQGLHEYILIGEVDYGASGTPGGTWGMQR